MDELESHTIQWQEKRLSSNEIDFYSTIENCKTDIQKKYHQIIKINGLVQDDANNGTKVLDKIFTYIPDDCFVPSIDIQNANKEFSGIERNYNFQLSLNAKNTRRKQESEEFETMYIMASLIETTDTILCKIKWKASDGLLVIYPDFNDINHTPYLKEIHSDCRHLYQYAIENLSKTIPARNDCEQNRQVITKVIGNFITF